MNILKYKAAAWKMTLVRLWRLTVAFKNERMFLLFSDAYHVGGLIGDSESQTFGRYTESDILERIILMPMKPA